MISGFSDYYKVTSLALQKGHDARKSELGITSVLDLAGQQPQQTLILDRIDRWRMRKAIQPCQTAGGKFCLCT